MEMKPATVILLVALLVALILPVFFLNMDEAANTPGQDPQDVPANAPHPHKVSPEMERELERMRREGKDRNPPPTPGNEVPANEAERNPTNAPLN